MGGQFFGLDFSLGPRRPSSRRRAWATPSGLLSGLFYGLSMFFNGYRKDADTTARGVWNFIFAVLGWPHHHHPELPGLSARHGETGRCPCAHHLQLDRCCSLWIICGPIALGFLLVAGRNLPAADYGTIAYWEVPVAIFVGLVVFGRR